MCLASMCLSITDRAPPFTGITDITVVNFLLGSFYHFISESYHGANLLLNILHAFLYWLRPSGIMVSCNVIEIFLVQGFSHSLNIS